MGRGAGVEPDPQPEVPQLPSAKRQSPSASQIAGGAGLNSTAVRGQEVLKALQNDDVLEQLKQITQEGPTKVAVLGTRFCTYLHQPVIELLSYALVLSGNRVITSGSQGTNACVIRGALRAQKPHLLTVILPQGFGRQEEDAQTLLYACMEAGATVIEAPENDSMPLQQAAELCNARVLNRAAKLIVFTFHNSSVLLKCVEDARQRGLITTVLYLD